MTPYPETILLSRVTLLPLILSNKKSIPIVLTGNKRWVLINMGTERNNIRWSSKCRAGDEQGGRWKWKGGKCKGVRSHLSRGTVHTAGAVISKTLYPPPQTYPSTPVLHLAMQKPSNNYSKNTGQTSSLYLLWFILFTTNVIYVTPTITFTTWQNLVLCSTLLCPDCNQHDPHSRQLINVFLFELINSLSFLVRPHRVTRVFL